MLLVHNVSLDIVRCVRDGALGGFARHESVLRVMDGVMYQGSVHVPDNQSLQAFQ